MPGQRNNPGFLKLLYEGIRADAPLYLAIVAYAVIGVGMLTLAGLGNLVSYASYLKQWLTMFLVIFPAAALCLHGFRLIHRFDRRRLQAARRIFGKRPAAYFLSGVCLVMAMMVFQGTFTSIKNGMSAWKGGFPYDRQHADIDAILHFGIDPWRILYSFAKSDRLLGFIEWNYGVAWFILCFGGLFYVATSARTSAFRTRYLLSFMLTWIVVGNVFAGLFLSAGPAFYGHVTGDVTRFSEQLAFLAQGAGGDGSVAYQNYLWTLHANGITGFATGISAFPSMHVGLVTLNALFIWEHSRVLGAVAFAYVAFILASSVYLAWHYAIDGYAAIGLTFLIFWALRRWLPGARRAEATPDPTARGIATVPAT